MISKLSPVSPDSYLSADPPRAMQPGSKPPKPVQEYTAFDDALRRAGQEDFGVDDGVAEAEDVIQQDAHGQEVQSRDDVDELDGSMTPTEDVQSVDPNALAQIDFGEMTEATDQMSVVHAVFPLHQADEPLAGGKLGGTTQSAAQGPAGAAGTEATALSGTGVRLVSGQPDGATAAKDLGLDTANSILRGDAGPGLEGAGAERGKTVVELAAKSNPLAVSAKEHVLQRVWQLPEGADSAAEASGETLEEVLAGNTAPRSKDTLAAMGAEAGMESNVVMQTSAQMSVAMRSEREMSLSGSVPEENRPIAQGGLEGLNPAGDRVVVSTTSTAAPPHALRADASQIVGQMSASIRRNGLGQTEVALNPPELGSVKISLESRDSGMVVSISADKPETMDLIRRHIDQLEQDLIEMGYASLTFDFASSDEQASGDAGESPQDQGGGTMISEETAPVDVLRQGAGTEQGASGVDIRL